MTVATEATLVPRWWAVTQGLALAGMAGLMVALAVGTFFVFLPHTVLWGIRELFIKKEKPKVESKD